MKIQRFECNPLQENCYVVSDESGQAAIIDCGVLWSEEQQALSQYISDGRLQPSLLLCTHGHFDHIFGNDFVYHTWGLQPRVHQADLTILNNAETQMRQIAGTTVPIAQVPTGPCLADGDTLTLGHHRLQVLHTPGHSPGSVVLWCQEEGVAFTGDTLFRMSVGRTDLPGGSFDDLCRSLQRLARLLPPETRLLTGHGPATLMSDELRYNPYLR